MTWFERYGEHLDSCKKCDGPFNPCPGAEVLMKAAVGEALKENPDLMPKLMQAVDTP